jgi:HflK protein
VVAALWLASGFFQIKSAERGVILRFGKLVDVRQEGWGWRWPWPIETVTKVNVANVNSTDYKQRVLTSDVNLVDLHFSVQYQYTDPKKVLFQVYDPDATLSEVSEAAIREVVGRSKLDQVLVGGTRPQITKRTKELIQKTLDYYNTGITVTTVNLVDVQVPDAVIPSQRDANKALADQERYIKEAQANANSIIPVAQGAAARMQQDAQAYKAQVVAIAEGQAVALHRAVGRLRAGAGSHAQTSLHGHHREPARAGSQGRDRPEGRWRRGAATCSICRSTSCWTRPRLARPSSRTRIPPMACPRSQDSVTVEARGRGER